MIVVNLHRKRKLTEFFLLQSLVFFLIKFSHNTYIYWQTFLVLTICKNLLEMARKGQCRNKTVNSEIES